MKRLVSTLMATLLLASYFAVPVFAQESSFNLYFHYGFDCHWLAVSYIHLL